jgi:acyl carrier protein
LASAPVRSSIVEQLQGVNAARRHELLLGFVGEHVAKVIGSTAADSIDPRQPLNELGLDSLMAVDLRNRLSASLGLARSLPATLVFDHPTLEALASYLASDVLAPAGDAAGSEEAVDAAAPPASDAVGALDEMSDDEIEKMFAKRMKR